MCERGIRPRRLSSDRPDAQLRICEDLYLDAMPGLFLRS